MKKDGTSRLVKASFPATYEEFRAQAAAGTLTLDMLFNAAGWSQLPTFLAKANLLTDETEQILWGNAADRTVDLALRKLFSELQVPRFLQAYTVAGSYQWTVPEDGDYVAVIIGGGGGGGASCGGNASGGGAGYVNFWAGALTFGTQVALVVGEGGSANSIQSGHKGGNSGGASSFNGVTADGGEGGSAAESGYAAPGGLGGQAATYYNDDTPIPMGGVTVVYSRTSSGISVAHGTPIPAIFLDENGLPISCLCAGGGIDQTVARILPNGKTMSPGGALSTNDGPTDCGAGGGARALPTGNTVNSVPGADGGVFIYKVMGGDLT